MIKIIDNFLPEEEFKSIQRLMMGNMFPWSYCQGRTTPDDGSFLMVHMFFREEVGQSSQWMKIWVNLMNKLGAKKCTRIKANLTFKTPTIETAPFHTDFADMKTATFYISTNNGYTEFENGVRVNSVANRVCIFDSNLFHCGTTHSEGGHQRVVVNFNYA